jgi:hypothetical protein
MKAILVALSILILTQISSARLGETLEQCKARYGEVLEETDRADGKLRMFIKQPCALLILFDKNEKALAIAYIKNKESPRFTPQEIKTLLNSNCEGSIWHAGKLTTNEEDMVVVNWYREDGKAFAKYDDVLFIRYNDVAETKPSSGYKFKFSDDFMQ